jgi:hypothetical protein
MHEVGKDQMITEPVAVNVTEELLVPTKSNRVTWLQKIAENSL